MPTKSKRPARYNPKGVHSRRNLLMNIGLIAVVVIFGASVVFWFVVHAKHPTAEKALPPSPIPADQTKAIRVTSDKLITNPGTKDPKVVLSLYEDFLCPACGNFETQLGSTVNQLIDSGAVAADYYMLGFLDSDRTQHYSSRSAGAAYCVADQSVDAFRRFHAALYAQQPAETGTSFPDDAKLIETARQAGVAGGVPDCITSGKYVLMTRQMVAPSRIDHTPTIRINGQDYNPSTPQALIDKINSIVGDVPGLIPGTKAPAPTPAP